MLASGKLGIQINDLPRRVDRKWLVQPEAEVVEGLVDGQRPVVVGVDGAEVDRWLVKILMQKFNSNVSKFQSYSINLSDEIRLGWKSNFCRQERHHYWIFQTNN